MASTRIAYPVNTPWGAQVAEFTSLYMQARVTALRIKAAMDSMSSNGAGPWTDLESELGLAAGQGQALYGVIADGLNSMNSWSEVSQIDVGS